MYLHVDNEEYAEITEFPGISKTTRPYDTHPEQPVNQTEFNPRRDASPIRNFLLYFYKTEVCKKEKDMLFLIKFGYLWLRLPLRVHRFSLYLLHSPSANLSEFYPPYLFSPISVHFHPSSIRDPPRRTYTIGRIPERYFPSPSGNYPRLFHSDMSSNLNFYKSTIIHSPYISSVPISSILTSSILYHFYFIISLP